MVERIGLPGRAGKAQVMLPSVLPREIACRGNAERLRAEAVGRSPQPSGVACRYRHPVLQQPRAYDAEAEAARGRFGHGPVGMGRSMTSD
jgi:hypothetical protein